MADSVERKRIEPTLPLCMAEPSVENPFKEMVAQKFGLTRGRLILQETWTAFLKSR